MHPMLRLRSTKSMKIRRRWHERLRFSQECFAREKETVNYYHRLRIAYLIERMFGTLKLARAYYRHSIVCFRLAPLA